MARRLIIVAAALLVGVQVVRNAAVRAFATLRPSVASKFWPGHPAVEISLGLADIGHASLKRKEIEQRTFRMIQDAAVKAPLSSEPFLVRGVQEQLAGDLGRARAAFLAAQRRDPRSLPAAYFLANDFFRSGRVLDGLEQTSLLARLAPGGSKAVAPFVAAYAQDRANWPQIRALFARQEGLEDEVLNLLANDAANADAILALASQQRPKENSPWLTTLLDSLVEKGEYGRARALWSSTAAVRADGELVYDKDFSAPGAPPPFNWSFASSTIGLAEREPGKQLHVIFYGNQDGLLASQLVLLQPGTYRLQMAVKRQAVHPELLSWSVRCDKSQEPVATADLAQTVASGLTIQIPPRCAAQWIELSGRSGDVSQQSDVTITGLRLTRVRGNV